MRLSSFVLIKQLDRILEIILQDDPSQPYRGLCADAQQCTSQPEHLPRKCESEEVCPIEVYRFSLFLQYDDSEEGEKLLPRSPRSMEEGLEMRGDYAPPSWLDKLEEAQYSLSK